MQAHQYPPCPRCRRTDVELLSRRDVHQRIRGHGPRSEQPHETVYVFKCKCGAAFTHDVKHDGHARGG
jgi:hypothetical protein